MSSERNFRTRNLAQCPVSLERFVGVRKDISGENVSGCRLAIDQKISSNRIKMEIFLASTFRYSLSLWTTGGPLSTFLVAKFPV